MRPLTLCGEEVPRAGHICAFFDSREQKYDALAPFLSDAISAGDRILNIVDASDTEAHLQTLRENRVPVQQAMHTGQLNVLTSEETYLEPGIVDLSALLDVLQEKLQTAQQEHRCLRTWGEMKWIGRSPLPIERILEYEARVNLIFPTFDCTLICVYDLATTPSAIFSDILATHPFAILKGRLRPNPYYVRPEDYLDMVGGR